MVNSTVIKWATDEKYEITMQNSGIIYAQNTHWESKACRQSMFYNLSSVEWFLLKA